MHSVLTKKVIVELLFSVLITTSFPANGVWDTLKMLLEKSKKIDAVKLSVGVVAVGTVAYYAYLIQLEIAEKEDQIRTYQSYMHGTCLYVIEKRQDDTMVKPVSAQARSLAEQHQDCVHLARYFGNESMRINAAIKKNQNQKDSIDSW